MAEYADGSTRVCEEMQPMSKIFPQNIHQLEGVLNPLSALGLVLNGAWIL